MFYFPESKSRYDWRSVGVFSCFVSCYLPFDIYCPVYAGRLSDESSGLSFVTQSLQ
jgi:hypothetical protein